MEDPASNPSQAVSALREFVLGVKLLFPPSSHFLQLLLLLSAHC